MKIHRAYEFPTDLAATDFVRGLDSIKIMMRALGGTRCRVILHVDEFSPDAEARKASVDKIAADLGGKPAYDWKESG